MELKVFNLVAFTKKKKKSFFGGPGYPLTGAVLTQANWTITATALVASVRQGDTNASAIQNITPPGVSASNRAYGQGGATTATAANITVIAAGKLIANSSGLFKGWLNMSWAALTAADVGTLTINVFTDAVAGVPLTLGNVCTICFC